MAVNNQIKELRKIESEINKHLFWVCAGVTIVVMLMVVIEFFSRGEFSSSQIGLFYLGVLIIYSFHKELIRWLGEKKVVRQGEHFVYGWIGLVTFLYLIDFFSKGLFSYSIQGEPLIVLRNASVLALEVLAIFIFTRSLKMLKFFWNSKNLS